MHYRTPFGCQLDLPRHANWLYSWFTIHAALAIYGLDYRVRERDEVRDNHHVSRRTSVDLWDV
jgi:hypothetical protein